MEQWHEPTAEELADMTLKLITEMQTRPNAIKLETPKKTEQPSNKARLTYYRTHGLTHCDDYPGGDAQFEKDVLSGQFHMQKISTAPMMQEDQYIYDKMYAGDLRFDNKFKSYFTHPMLLLAYIDNAHRNGFRARISHPGGPLALRLDIETGRFAERKMKLK